MTKATPAQVTEVPAVDPASIARALLEMRLENLRTELSNGSAMLNEGKRKQAELGATLYRISGAIQVLEEMLAPAQG